MKTGTKVLIAVLSIAAALIVIPAAGFVYVTRYAEREIETVTLADSGYRLTVCEIGEPDWPFGAAHCCFDLRDGEETVTKLKFDVHDDGGSPSPGNFHVHWFTNFVRIVVTASEQPDTLYDLYYDGSAEINESRVLTETEEEAAAKKEKEDRAARRKVSRILDLNLPSDSEVQRNIDTHGGFHGDGTTYIQIRFPEGGAVLEQIEADQDWIALPMPWDVRMLARWVEEDKACGVLLPTDEELGEGYWFFLDRNSEAVDRRDYSAARQRFSVNFILAFYSIGEETLCFCQADS